MRSLPALLAVVVLCVGLTACGEGARSNPKTASGASAGPSPAVTTASSATPGQPYLNDGDAEKTSDHDGDNQPGTNHDDGDGDSHEEYEDTYDNGDYHDGDDSRILSFGDAASPSDSQAITAVVNRYYAAAAAGDGARACATMTRSTVETMVEDYGHGSVGPAYLRSGKSCQAVQSLLFRHLRSQLAGAVHVTGVRVKGDEAYALLGSTTMPAGFIVVRREGGSWKVGTLTGGPLP